MDKNLRKLDTFKGYTVDPRLREFRRLTLGQMPEFIPFDSQKGQRLLTQYYGGARDGSKAS